MGESLGKRSCGYFLNVFFVTTSKIGHALQKEAIAILSWIRPEMVTQQFFVCLWFYVGISMKVKQKQTFFEFIDSREDTFWS